MSRTAGDRPKSKTTSNPPPAPDVLEPGEADAIDADSYGPYPLYAAEEAEFPAAAPEGPPASSEETASEWLRMHARLLLREFLSVVPRSEEATTITFLRVDGTLQTRSRHELSAAIDRMRPRQRQIVRLAVEERWPQERVCAALKGISVRTVQRDLAEALDRLAQL
ncbi:MAG: sigma factor-like helix-turn-helix DNA-binding protein [Ktedonobacterales bacterium]